MKAKNLAVKILLVIVVALGLVFVGQVMLGGYGYQLPSGWTEVPNEGYRVNASFAGVCNPDRRTDGFPFAQTRPQWGENTDICLDEHNLTAARLNNIFYPVLAVLVVLAGHKWIHRRPDRTKKRLIFVKKGLATLGLAFFLIMIASARFDTQRPPGINLSYGWKSTSNTVVYYGTYCLGSAVDSSGWPFDSSRDAECSGTVATNNFAKVLNVIVISTVFIGGSAALVQGISYVWRKAGKKT